VITDFLLEQRALVPVALLAMALGCVALGYLARGRHGSGERIMGSLALLSLLAVLALTLVPSGNSPGDVGCTVQVSYPTFGRVELAANVALYFPLAFFLTLAARRPVLALAAGSVLSAGSETVQAIVPALGRACDTNDWLMNTLGAAAGVLLALGTAALADRLHAGGAGHPEGHTSRT
jgi:VanZ family protein